MGIWADAKGWGNDKGDPLSVTEYRQRVNGSFREEEIPDAYRSSAGKRIAGAMDCYRERGERMQTVRRHCER